MKPKVYKITCLANDKIYIGVSTDSLKRFKQHKYHPPTRMRKDAAQYRPWEDFFRLELLMLCISAHEAHRHERTFIRTHKGQTSLAYNTIDGTPYTSRKFWWLRYRKLV